MKIQRQIGILSILLQRGKVTAPYLAEKFEVSRRTINRDIEDICRAGIPLVTSQGQNGGISIMEGYRLDKTLLTSSDMQAILAGLRSLDSVCGTNRYQQLMEKLSAGNSNMLASNQHIKIDLSSWYKTSLAPKIERIQRAVEERKTLKFRYYSPRGEGFRKLEPYFLLFQWASWYVWGYCPERQDFRLFKLNRMLDLDKTEETFQMRDFQMPDLSIQKAFPNTMEVKAVLKPAMKWRLIEEFGPDSFQEEADGSLLFSFGFADKDNLFSWLLSFGDQVRLLEPKNLVPEFTAMVKRISEQYER